MIIAHYFGETPFYLFWKSLLCLSISVQSWFYVLLNVLLVSMSFCLLYLKQSYFCYLSLYIYIPRDIFVILFFLTFVPLYSPPSRGSPDFCQEKGHWLEGSPDSQSESLLRCRRGSVKGSMVPGGGLWVYLALSPSPSGAWSSPTLKKQTWQAD
jgi:hypothetical protein